MKSFKFFGFVFLCFMFYGLNQSFGVNYTWNFNNHTSRYGNQFGTGKNINTYRSKWTLSTALNNNLCEITYGCDTYVTNGARNGLTLYLRSGPGNGIYSIRSIAGVQRTKIGSSYDFYDQKYTAIGSTTNQNLDVYNYDVVLSDSDISTETFSLMSTAIVVEYRNYYMSGTDFIGNLYENTSDPTENAIIDYTFEDGPLSGAIMTPSPHCYNYYSTTNSELGYNCYMSGGIDEIGYYNRIPNYMYIPLTTAGTAIFHYIEDDGNIDITIVDCTRYNPIDYSSCNIVSTGQILSSTFFNSSIDISYFLSTIDSYSFNGGTIVLSKDNGTISFNTVVDDSSYNPLTYTYIFQDEVIDDGDYGLLTGDYTPYDYTSQFSTCNTSRIYNDIYFDFSTGNTYYLESGFNTEYGGYYLTNFYTNFGSVNIFHKTNSYTGNIRILDESEAFLTKSYLTFGSNIQGSIFIDINGISYSISTTKVFIKYDDKNYNLSPTIDGELACNSDGVKDVFFDKDGVGELNFGLLENTVLDDNELNLSIISSGGNLYIYYLSVFKYLDTGSNDYYIYFYGNKELTSTTIESVESQVANNTDIEGVDFLASYDGFFSCDRNNDLKTTLLEYAQCGITLAQKTFDLLTNGVENIGTTLVIIGKLGDVEEDVLFTGGDTLIGINGSFSNLFDFESSNNPGVSFYIFLKYVIYTCFIFVILVILFI